jgi:hypothetical protein
MDMPARIAATETGVMSHCSARTSRFLRRWPGRKWAETSLLSLLILLFAVKGFLPAWSHLDPDFPNYYLVARLYRDGYPVERVYDWMWFQRQKDHRGIERPLVGFIPSTLLSGLLVLPLSSLSPLPANRCWLVISLGFLVVATALVQRITRLTWRRIGLLTFLAIAPLESNFRLGQVHTILLFLLAVAAWFYFRDWQFSSGVVLASAAAISIYPAFFLLLFLIKRQWRAACGLAVGTASAAALSIYLFGVNACRVYLRDVLPSGLRGEVGNPYVVQWDSLNALLRRLFIAEPELNPTPVAHLPLLYAFLQSLTYAFFLTVFLWAIGRNRDSRSRQKLEWAIYLFLLLLVSSQPFPFHFLALILTIALVVDYLVTHRQAVCTGLVVVLYALVCLPYNRLYEMNPTGWTSLLFFPRLCFMVLLGGVLLWILISSSGTPLGRSWRTSYSLAMALVFAALAIGGFLLNRRHLSGQFDNYRTRVATVVGSAIAADPAVSSESLFFDALVPRFNPLVRDAYAVHKLHAGSITSYGTGVDWFHPAVTKTGRKGWAEMAANSGSQIVGFDPTRPITDSAPLTVEAADAEQPAVSPEGELLAFIREAQGRGSLWVRRMGPAQTAPSSPERELAGVQYDVHEAAFSPDNAIIFSSEQGGRFRLYKADPQTENVAPVIAVTCSARYPAVSPDDQWMAFSCQERGAWQLWVLNLRTHEQRQFTNTECNSITPAWTADSTNVIYATDCGRALGTTALSRLTVVP